jgi:glucosylceramidase
MVPGCDAPHGSGGATSGVGGANSGVGGATSELGGATSELGGATSELGGATSELGGAGGGTAAATLVTSAEGQYWQLGQLEAAASGQADVSVDGSAVAQTWQGFGGAFTELGWVYLSQLSHADRDLALQLLFGPEGARFTWGRIPIGGNDYVLSRHTLDDTGEDVVPNSLESNRPPADLELAHFSIDKDLQSVVPFIKAAQALKPDMRFWAVPWTPPVWMKTGYIRVDDAGAPVNRPSYYDGGSMKSDAATLQAHADYFVRFLRAYHAQSIPVELVAPQNEPGGGHTYPSCLWDTSTYVSFIGNYLGPTLKSSGLGTQIMLGGSFDVSSDSAFVSAVLGDATAKSYCTVAGVGYDMAAAAKVAPIKAAGLPVWVSEHKAGNYPWAARYQPIAPNDLAYAIETWGLIRDAITLVGVSAYNAWHLVLDNVGKNVDTTDEWAQNSLLVVNAGQLKVTPTYYVFRHLARYVEPGAKVVSTRGGDAVAFKNPDSSTVVVLRNAGAAKTMLVDISGKRLRFSAPANGFATLVVP